MPIGDTLGGFIRPGYNPLLVTDAPTIGTASPGGALAVSITFTAPSDVGGGAITSYEAVATDTVTAAVFRASGSSSPVTITGLTDGQTYTTTVSATNAYGPSGISAASNSFQAALALELWTWGYNNYGQLGQGNTTTYSSPVQVGALTDWLQISGGYNSAFAVKTDGTLWSWGYNNYGNLGDSSTTNRSSPVQIGSLTTWLQVAGGYNSSLAIKTDNTLWGWGRNYKGELGQGNTTVYSSPVQVGALTDWSGVASGGYLFVAVKTDGTLWSCGWNSSGQLGDNSTTDRSSPVQVGALTTWSKVETGRKMVVALKTDNTLWAWGEGNDGALGQENTTDYSSPVQVGALTDWTDQFAGGGDDNAPRAVTIKSDGTAWLWGAGNYGALGHNNTTAYSSPVQLGSLTTWSKITTTDRATYAIKTDGTLWSWGWNGYGGLGLNNLTNYSSPVQVGALTTWNTLASASGSDGTYGMALKS